MIWYPVHLLFLAEAFAGECSTTRSISWSLWTSTLRRSLHHCSASPMSKALQVIFTLGTFNSKYSTTIAPFSFVYIYAHAPAICSPHVNRIARITVGDQQASSRKLQLRHPGDSLALSIQHDPEKTSCSPVQSVNRTNSLSPPALRLKSWTLQHPLLGLFCRQ